MLGGKGGCCARGKGFFRARDADERVLSRCAQQGCFGVSRQQAHACTRAHLCFIFFNSPTRLLDVFSLVGRLARSMPTKQTYTYHTERERHRRTHNWPMPTRNTHAHTRKRKKLQITPLETC